jgi:hypothetical protein
VFKKETLSNVSGRFDRAALREAGGDGEGARPRQGFVAHPACVCRRPARTHTLISPPPFLSPHLWPCPRPSPHPSPLSPLPPPPQRWAWTSGCASRCCWRWRRSSSCPRWGGGGSRGGAAGVGPGHPPGEGKGAHLPVRPSADPSPPRPHPRPRRPQKVRSLADLKQCLTMLGGLTLDDVIAVELLWTPQVRRARAGARAGRAGLGCGCTLTLPLPRPLRLARPRFAIPPPTPPRTAPAQPNSYCPPPTPTPPPTPPGGGRLVQQGRAAAGLPRAGQPLGPSRDPPAPAARRWGRPGSPRRRPIGGAPLPRGGALAAPDRACPGLQVQGRPAGGRPARPRRRRAAPPRRRSRAATCGRCVYPPPSPLQPPARRGPPQRRARRAARARARQRARCRPRVPQPGRGGGVARPGRVPAHILLPPRPLLRGTAS